jgi:predicted dienelactone hydrolase
VKALVAMAPGGELHVFGDAGLAELRVPVMILQGTNDDMVSPDYNAYWAYERLGSTNKTLVKLQGGNHLMFARVFGYAVNPAGPESDDPKAYLSTAFLLDLLTGDEAAHAALLPDAVTFDGVEYTTTLQ